MSLPEESVAANTLPEVTTIPTGKKLIFTDPDTNEGGIITLENLSKQILQNLTSQTFTLDQGNLTLLQALNQLNSKTFSIYQKNVYDLDNPPNAFILNSGVNPKGLPDLGGNGCCVIQHNPDNGTYTAQLAFSFGSDKIAIRRKKESSWSDWAYFSAQ